MRLSLVPALAAALLIAGCSSEASEEAASMAEDASGNEAGAAPRMAGGPEKLEVKDGAAQPGDAIAPRAPQIAYVYDYGFRLAGEKIAPLQQRHADLCESKGPEVCRIISMEQSGYEGEYGSGTLALAVAAPKAREFGRELGKVAKDAEGEQVSSAIAGEDLSKQIVDTEARLRARTLLRDRLMEVLATRKGTVAELVEAERGVAQVNEEIDQASSWLAEMRGRVAYSRMNIAYTSGSPGSGGFLAPIRSAIGNISGILGGIVAILILLLAIGVPVAALFFAGRFAWVRSRPMRTAISGKPTGETGA